MGRGMHRSLNALALALSCGGAAVAQEPPPALTIQRASGPIAVDGDLSDAGWQGVPPVEKWYETNPGDNVEPAVRNTAYLAYDDAFFYAGFRFQDPTPNLEDPANFGAITTQLVPNPNGFPLAQTFYRPRAIQISGRFQF